jgi:hypothetical protein
MIHVFGFSRPKDRIIEPHIFTMSKENAIFTITSLLPEGTWNRTTYTW